MPKANGRRLRLLVVNWQDRRNPEAGGAEVHAHEIFGRLAARGHRVSLLVSGWPGAPREEVVDGVRVHRAGRRHTFPLVVWRAYRRLPERPFDLVVEDVNKLPLFAPLWAGAPVVALVPHLFGGTAFREAAWPVAAVVWMAEKLMPWFYRDVAFQAISRSTADDLVARGFRRDRIDVIPPGVDGTVYRPDPAVRRFPDPTAVHVGRLKRYKGLEVAIRAVARVRARGLPLRLLVAGRGNDRPRLERIARREGVADAVEFLGHVSRERKVELLRRAWVHIYASPKEGWGISNVEAAACGTPCLASDSPGLRDSVAEGESGFLVPHASPDAWAERLERLAGDGALRKRLREGALRHASRFSWERAARETERSLLRAVQAAERPEGAASPPGTGARTAHGSG